MISLDQTLWWIEIIFRLIRGRDHPKRWVLGVAKYLDAPETTRAKFWTAWHHLWFMPLLLWTMSGHGYVPAGSYLMQVALMTVLGMMSRVLTPYQVYEPHISKTHVVYLNINLSHRFWKDIHTRNWGKLDRFFARGWECSSKPRDDFSHIYDDEEECVRRLAAPPPSCRVLRKRKGLSNFWTHRPCVRAQVRVHHRRLEVPVLGQPDHQRREPRADAGRHDHPRRHGQLTTRSLRR